MPMQNTAKCKLLSLIYFTLNAYSGAKIQIFRGTGVMFGRENEVKAAFFDVGQGFLAQNKAGLWIYYKEKRKYQLEEKKIVLG